MECPKEWAARKKSNAGLFDWVNQSNEEFKKQASLLFETVTLFLLVVVLG